MKYNYKIGTFLGAPIYFNIFTLLAILYYWASSSFLSGLTSGIAFILLMLFHEMGHAYFVKKYHHDLIKIHLYPIHGICKYEYDSNFEPETLIYAGGILVQGFILIVTFTLFNLLNKAGQADLVYFMSPIGKVFIQTNLIILFTNSLPIRGLDGYVLWIRLFEFLKAKSFFKIFKKSSKNKKPKIQSAKNIVDMAIEKAKKD